MNLGLPLRWKWFAAVALVLVDLLLVVNVWLDVSLPPFLVQKIRADLERDARLTRAVVARAGAEACNPLAHDLARQTGLRVTLIAADGTVLGESEKPPDELAQIENHLYRPEIQEALHDGVGSATRHSATIGVDLLYVAVPLNPTNDAPAAPGVPAFVRVALPLHEIAQTTGRVRHIVAVASIAVALITLPIVYWMAGRSSAPIVRMRRMAEQVARGDFSAHAPERIGGELGELGAALNQMAGQLDARLRELASDKAHLGGILGSMTEGVLVVDAAGKIRLLNDALRQAVGVTNAVVGKTVIEAFRSVALEQLIAAAPASREVTFVQAGDRVFIAQAGPLAGKIGVVVVFHDITRLKQLENIRKEFVANVSHELRTPLSIIKGYVETLLEEQPPDAATGREFLQTIQRHARRLESLIEDLLSISALESQQARLETGPRVLRDAAGAVVDELARQAREKSIGITLQIPAELTVRADARRLHQVLFNLVDNAVKYIPAGGRVVVSARETEGSVECCVADDGPGIAREHLPHLFERFYRVDKARSRDLGGTGLGLSIVKHIVQAHGGRVWAESEPGQGSRFYFTLPRA